MNVSDFFRDNHDIMMFLSLIDRNCRLYPEGKYENVVIEVQPETHLVVIPAGFKSSLANLVYEGRESDLDGSRFPIRMFGNDIQVGLFVLGCHGPRECPRTSDRCHAELAKHLRTLRFVLF